VVFLYSAARAKVQSVMPAAAVDGAASGQPAERPPLKEILAKSGKRALGGGIPGAVASTSLLVSARLLSSCGVSNS
jgi:hypothetical protein